jgi:hypothetical protein
MNESLLVIIGFPLRRENAQRHLAESWKTWLPYGTIVADSLRMLYIWVKDSGDSGALLSVALIINDRSRSSFGGVKDAKKAAMEDACGC